MLACQAAVKSCEESNLSLYHFTSPGNLPTISATLKTVMDIRQSITENWEKNPEVIWALNTQFDFQSMAMPRLTNAMVQNMDGARGNFAVPIGMAELFYSKNGVPMAEDAGYDYRGRYAVAAAGTDSKYYLKVVTRP